MNQKVQAQPGGLYGAIAQLEEHLTVNQKRLGSNPSGPAK
jgi:hypothetical protein